MQSQGQVQRQGQGSSQGIHTVGLNIENAKELSISIDTDIDTETNKDLDMNMNEDVDSNVDMNTDMNVNSSLADDLDDVQDDEGVSTTIATTDEGKGEADILDDDLDSNSKAEEGEGSESGVQVKEELTAEHAKGVGSSTSLASIQNAVIGEPFTKYLIGFGRNPFGRFSLTAAYNEKTGQMRCEKKYITSKGRGKRGRKPGSLSAGLASARLSIESNLSSIEGGDGSLSARAMSTRPRKSLPDSSFFFPSSYEEAQHLLPVSGTHAKKRKLSIDGFEGIRMSKEKGGGGQFLAGSSSSGHIPFPSQRERDREKDRERNRNREKEQDMERELDDSNSDYRIAYMDDETGEVYEGGWYAHAQRRHGMGICLYSDGTMYEGSWSMGREHGKGQLMTGERSTIYEGEWVDGTMTGQGTYNFSNGDRYTGDWREGIRHGRGEYVLSNGCRYNGDWKNNKRTGSGIFHWSDGSTFDGDWENDNRHGRGLLILANGFRYDGGWHQNYMEGRGVTIFPGGQEYQGSYRAGLREGRGSIKFAQGAVYEGRFRDDRIDGQGTIMVTESMPGAEEGEILIPIQIQADIRRIHLKAGFGADAAH
jgi:hypothetical protein